MASFTEKINVIIDVTTDKATAGIKGFKTAVSDAEGFTGKLKAGVGSLGDQFRKAAANPAVMAGGIAAAGTAAFAAVNEFANLGIEVGKFSEATGLAAEDSSRWIEVAGDVGVEVGTLESSIGKLNKAIDPKLFAELGIEIKRTSDGATDVNGTFLNVIDKLKGIRDPAERAKVATKLLGKGWQDMAELIGLGSDALKDSLAGVSDAKVIDEAEVEKARKFREAMDRLNDAFQDIVLQVGETLIPAFTKAADAVGQIGEKAGLVIPILSDMGDALNEIGSWSPTLDPIGFMDNLMDTTKLTTGAIKDGAIEARQTADAIIDLGDGAKEAAEKTYLLEQAEKDATAATKEMDDAYSALIGKLDEEEAWKNIQTKLFEFKDGLGDTAGEQADLTREMANFIERSKEIPTEVKTALYAKLDQGDIDAVQRYLDQLRAGVAVPVYVNPKAGASSRLPGAKFATGTSWAAGGQAMVHKDEIINLPRGASVTPAGQAQQMRQRGGGGQIGTVIVNTTDPPRRWLDELSWRVR